MMNSTILSIFASIEDKKIEELIVYLGEEKILEKYSKLIVYTTKFDDLLELYGKCKNGVNIQSQIDDGGSTATLSNSSSLSPRISPNGSSSNHIMNGSLFDHHSIDQSNDYSLEHKIDQKEEEEQQQSYKDSPYPKKYKSKELRLPNRTTKNDNDQSFDLLFNANQRNKKRQNEPKKKIFNLSILSAKNHNKNKESSPFLNVVSNAMDHDEHNGNHKKIITTKRKFDQISNKSPTTNNDNNYIANHFEIGHCLNSSDASKENENGSDYPPRKKIKIMMNGMGMTMNGHSASNHINNGNEQDVEVDKDTDLKYENMRNSKDDHTKKKINDVTKSILMNNGTLKTKQKQNKINKHVRFIGTENEDIDITMTHNKLEPLRQTAST